jgi:hypothetical protein
MIQMQAMLLVSEISLCKQGVHAVEEIIWRRQQKEEEKSNNI